MKNHAVVIAGGGPTGLMLAAELALAKVDVVIVEKRATQDVTGSRASGLHARTIEILDQRGVAGRFLSQGKTGSQIPAFGGLLDIGDLPTRHNYTLALWQERIEHILADWAVELAVPILRSLEVTDFSQDEAGVDISLSDGQSLRAEFLVGCDGGRSVIRKKAGIAFPGWDASNSYLIAEFSASDEPTWGIRHGEKGINALAKLGDGRRVRAVLVEPQIHQAENPTTLDDLRSALVAVYGTDFGLHDVTFLSRFTDAARQAASYRNDRVLLAGDAAHVHSPAGGQGLNTGVQDAMNLGWKLAQVVHGQADGSLLDTYHSERHPVGARLLETTMALTAMQRGDARTEALREIMSDLVGTTNARQRYAARLTGLDVHYDLGDGHPLLGRRMPDLDLSTEKGSQRVFSLMHDAQPLLINFGEPGTCNCPSAAGAKLIDAKYTGKWLLPAIGEVSAPSAVLVRPDGYVAWVGAGANNP